MHSQQGASRAPLAPGSSPTPLELHTQRDRLQFPLLRMEISPRFLRREKISAAPSGLFCLVFFLPTLQPKVAAFSSFMSFLCCCGRVVVTQAAVTLKK